jgi:hypothetical protein
MREQGNEEVAARMECTKIKNGDVLWNEEDKGSKCSDFAGFEAG